MKSTHTRGSYKKKKKEEKSQKTDTICALGGLSIQRISEALKDPL